MNTLLEIKASACLFVVGPQLTRNSPYSARLSYRSVIKSGSAFLEKSGVDCRYDTDELIETEPVKAMRETVQCLEEMGLYDEWLKETFCDFECLSSKVPDSVQRLLELQQMGSMLACTQYDNLLDNLAGTRPVSVSSEDADFMEWLAHGELDQEESTLSPSTILPDNAHTGLEKDPTIQFNKGAGFLHLHGIQTAVNSICLLPHTSEEESEVESMDTDSESPALNERWAAVRNVFRTKLVFFVGFDEDHSDPLLLSLFKILYPQEESKLLRNPPIFLTSSPRTPDCFLHEESKFLQLRISSTDHLRDIIIPAASKNFSVGKEHTDKHCKVQAFLLFNEKQSFRKLGDIIYQQSKSGEIYVRRDALTVIFDNNGILYGNLVTYRGNGLKRLWDLVFADGSTLLRKGLVALGLQGAAIVWVNNKPPGLGNITGINSVHTIAAHQAVHNMAIAQKSCSVSEVTKSPPFYMPVFSTLPSACSASEICSSAPSTSSSSSMKSPTGCRRKSSEDYSRDVASDTAFTTNSNITSSSSDSPSLSIPFPLGLNPISCALLSGLGAPANLTNSQYIVKNQLLSSLPPVSFHLPIQPTSVPFSIPSSLIPFSIPPLPPPPPPPPSSSLTASFPYSKPVLSALTPPANYHFPLKLGHTDLETLTRLHSRISMELNTMASKLDEDSTDIRATRTNSSPDSSVDQDLSPHHHEGGGFRLCTSRPASILNQIPGYQEHLEGLLSMDEHIIKCIDTRSDLQKETLCTVMTSIPPPPTSTGDVLQVSYGTTNVGGFTRTTPSLIGRLPLLTSQHNLPFISPPPSGLDPRSQLNNSKSSNTISNNLTPIISPLLFSPTTSLALAPSSSKNYFILPTSFPITRLWKEVPPTPQHLHQLSRGAPMVATTNSNKVVTNSVSNSTNSPPTALHLVMPPPHVLNSNFQPVFSHSNNIPILYKSPILPVKSFNYNTCICSTKDTNQGGGGTEANVSNKHGHVECSDGGDRTATQSMKRKLLFSSPGTKILKLSSASMETSRKSHVEDRGIVINPNNMELAPPFGASCNTAQTPEEHNGGERKSNSDFQSDGRITMADEPTLDTSGNRNDNSVHLWQFLLNLLLTPNHGSVIQWTGNENEFKIINPVAIASLWQSVTDPEKDHMTSGELQSKFRSYCSLGILELVEEKTQTFKFLVNIHKYMIEHKHLLLSKIGL